MSPDDVKRLIAEAVAVERKRTAEAIRAVLGDPEGDYIGREERFVPDWPRTFAILAARIEADPEPEKCECAERHGEHVGYCDEPACMCYVKPRGTP